MKTCIATLAAAIVTAGAAYAANETITMNMIDADGVGKSIGTLDLPTPMRACGSRHISMVCHRVTMGFMSMSIRIVAPAMGRNGQPAAGIAAGGHYDPANTGKHLGPLGSGHKGDLPA